MRNRKTSDPDGIPSEILKVVAESAGTTEAVSYTHLDVYKRQIDMLSE